MVTYSFQFIPLHKEVFFLTMSFVLFFCCYSCCCCVRDLSEKKKRKKRKKARKGNKQEKKRKYKNNTSKYKRQIWYKTLEIFFVKKISPILPQKSMFDYQQSILLILSKLSLYFLFQMKLPRIHFFPKKVCWNQKQTLLWVFSKQDLALNNLQELICHETQRTNNPKLVVPARIPSMIQIEICSILESI